MRKYDSYKDSGVEWIEEIPSHWKVFLGSYLGKYSKGKGIRKDEVIETGLPCLRYGEIYTHYDLKLFETRSFISFETSENSVPYGPGNLFLTGSGEKSEEIGKCVVYLGNKPIWIGGDIIVLEPFEEFNPLFLSYLINAECIRIQREISSKGEIIVHIYSKNFREMRFPIPPLSEQHQIVSYLDRKTAQIDSLIEKTQRKIELLKENRISLINEAVTKGLNPHVEMKDSGLEWIGEIPSHWVNSKLGFYTTKIGSGSTPRGGSEVYLDEGVPFIRSQNVHFRGLILDGISFIDDKTHLAMLGSKVEEGDVLLNITGGSIGRCCVVQVKNEMNVNQHVSIIRTKPSLSNFFLNYILQSDVGQLQVRYNISGGNREGLTIEGIRDFQITLPPLSEQLQIVSYLDEHTQLIDKTVSVEERRIELLKAYRQSLISEVVTGKRKVTTDE
jgi:type I restriction enzyme S subunit